MTKCCRLREEDGRIGEVFDVSKAGLTKRFTKELLDDPLWVDVPGEPRPFQFFDGKGAVDVRVKSVPVPTQLIAARMQKTYNTDFTDLPDGDVVMSDDWKVRYALWQAGFDPDIILAPPTMMEKAKRVLGY